MSFRSGQVNRSERPHATPDMHFGILIFVRKELIDGVELIGVDIVFPSCRVYRLSLRSIHGMLRLKGGCRHVAESLVFLDRWRQSFLGTHGIQHRGRLCG